MELLQVARRLAAVLPKLQNMDSDFKDLFLEVRDLLLAVDGITETQKARITTFGNANGGICHVRTMPNGVDIGFLKGAKMTDSQR